MKKIIFCFLLLLVQVIFAQIVLTPFTADIPSSSFTSSLDAFGNEIVVSANYPLDISQRRFFVFEKNGNIISQETFFTPYDVAPYDSFGDNISINNDFIAASSRLNDQVASNAGAVYMYRKVDGDWMFFQKITAFDGVADDYFGSDVKVIGNQLFVSAINNEPIGQPTSTNSGAVYVYHFDGASWIYSQKITISGSYQFGIKMRVSDSKLVVASASSFGTAYLHTYHYNANTWNFSSSITPVNPINESISDFDLDNNQLFILPFNAMASSIYVYDDIANNWSLNTTITPLNYNEKMATNFKVKNDIMFVSLNFHALLYTSKTPVSVYRKINDNWTFQELIYGEGPFEQEDAFGTQIAITDDIVVIGAPTEQLPSAFSGRAYTFDVTLGINENTLNDLKAYPNPTSHLVHLTSNLAENISTIGIYQLDGKLMKTINYLQSPISFKEFQNGVYLLKVTMANGSYTCKRIVKI
ncbi:T9SS type A sorting domain-containing protein [Flavobacterium sp. 102]|uniref:T9SS type A sorting domain-containing protein n=1 Tax=Flavobacterium sp. 102 TaxID=2135623 RepID=UPI000EB324EA|nr:T9SS type A sorting domain-containing protein [Flavobacterium sp. 102]RKS02668.1 putative secreted protein (Por secretion system target) [Flavobacterium sp. 102]